MELKFTPFPYLKSSRFDYRPITEDDCQEMFLLRSNPDIMKFIPRPVAMSNDEVLEHIRMLQENLVKNTGISWALQIKNEKKLVGVAAIINIRPEHSRCEIGYMLLPEFHNQGFVTEAIQTLLKFIFHNLNFHSVEAIIDPQNIASERVLQKNGFKKEAHLRENEYWGGKYIDTVIYSLLKQDYSELTLSQ
jgi:ribosomal-protein-alanine N-acetyltransferase